MNTKAVVLGATGLIGAHLVNELALSKTVAEVVAITRRPIEYQSKKVTNIVLDFVQLANSKDAFAGDVFFSCLGTTVGAAGSIQAQRVVDLDYQLQAAKLAYAQGVDHYILVSSSGANAKSMSPYLKMKGELEALVQEIQFKHISIVQPSLLLGERSESRAGESFAARVMPIVCKLPMLNRYRPISGLEVAQKMVQIAHNPSHPFERISLDQLFL